MLKTQCVVPKIQKLPPTRGYQHNGIINSTVAIEVWNIFKNFLVSKKLKMTRSQIHEFGSVNVVKEEIKINKWILPLCRNDFQYREWKIFISLHEHDHSCNRFWLISTNRHKSRLSVDFEPDFEFDNLCNTKEVHVTRRKFNLPRLTLFTFGSDLIVLVLDGLYLS